MQILRDGRTLVNFSSNDYLGISQHPFLKQRASEWMNEYGTGCGASRLVTGNFEIFDRVEEKLVIPG
jgi:8-amino-7-oxononanoate synthase